VSAISNKSFTRSLYDVLSRFDQPVLNANAVLLPVVADRRLATLLDVNVGDPLLRINEVDFTRNAQAIVLSSEWHVPGVFEMRVNRRA
jgi:GntR family transcriptional regulator